ncbi:mid1-complementing activity 2 [Genlisea aurea]|uniref:Mid1-complementing activity 2 n=1 Tax=Genlisea aurea TaxID=192259 RepID=S8CTX5_9LAMI|nr:mid1-complementing activity 2 [Genlisea aurea]
MASWDQFGEAANVIQLAGLNAVALIGLIVKAANTARMHKRNCRQFAQHLKLIGNLLEQLRISELKKYPESREPLEMLEDALRRAYLLVNSCQEKSFLYLMAMGWNIVYQFRRSQEEIDRYLRIIPLIALLDNARLKDRLEEIQRDQREYTLDEDEQKVQYAISENDVKILKKSLSFSYPNLPFDKALMKEREKLQAELHHSQANLDVKQCEVIERLMEVTETAACAAVETESPRKVAVPEVDDETTNSSHNESRVWDEDWHADLLGCCSEPYLCVKTCVCPCDTLSKIATVASGKEIWEACNDILAYSLILSCCCYTCCIRRKLRRALGIEGGCLDDFLSHLMCCCCAVVQEWREVKIRGAEGSRIAPPPSQTMEH